MTEFKKGDIIRIDMSLYSYYYILIKRSNPYAKAWDIERFTITGIHGGGCQDEVFLERWLENGRCCIL